MIASIRRHWQIALLATIFGLLATLYSLTTPIFEASDEISHYPVIQHIATTGTLTIQRPGVETLWEQEGSQPPLYYMICAALTFWIDTSDLEVIRWRNPHAKLGIPLDPDNRNMVIHTEAEAFPWRGTVLAVHLIRLLGVVLGIGTVVITYLIALEAVPEQRWIALFASALAAFNPMFVFIAGSVNNDNLTILLSSWVILISTRVINDRLTPQRAALLAILSALASITKISGLTLYPVIGLVLLISALRTRNWKPTIYAGFALIAAWSVVASWWYIRNIYLYNELLGLNTHVAIAGGRSIDLLTLLRNEWYGFWVSYWALFGAVNILVDPRTYSFYALLSAFAVLGLIAWGIKTIRAERSIQLLIASLLGVQSAIVLGGVIRWTMTTYASQGRLMFPAIASLSTLTAIGLLVLISERFRALAALVLTAPLLAIAIAVPSVYIAPVYAAPRIIEALPDDALRIDAAFGHLRLLGATIPPSAVEKGGRVRVTLYWQAQEPLDDNFSLYIHALGRDYAEIGKIDSYPGAGALPTSRMQPGRIYVDHYSLELNTEFEAPTAIRIIVGVALHNADGTYDDIPAVREDGSTSDVMLDAGVAYPTAATDCMDTSEFGITPIASFGGFAVLWNQPSTIDASPGDEVPIELAWDRMGNTPLNWTVFVHLVDAANERVAQADSPPMNGFYPTSLWMRPCPVLDTHMLKIPADLESGSYSVLVGFYDANDPAFARAIAADASGQPYPDFAVPIATVQVTEQ